MVTNRSNDVRRPTHQKDFSEQLKDLMVQRSGNVIAVPEGTSLEVAIAALTAKLKEEEEYVDLKFDYDLTVPEGAIALHRSLNELFGFVSLQATPTFFGPVPPTIINVRVSRDQEVAVPFGRFAVPGLKGTIEAGVTWRDGIPYFQLKAHVTGAHRSLVEKINDAIRSRNDSLYKGSAISLAFPEIDDTTITSDFFPRFMETANLKKDDLIFSDDVQELVEVALFTPIEHTAMCRENGIPLKRGILLEGPYGVGKTLTASITASLAEKNGWTFIHLANVADLDKAYAFAKHHQPAITFCEDLDEVVNGPNRTQNINAILNSIDGIESKCTEIITVFTTNNIDDITRAMLRPGRIDTVVPVRAPDAKAVTRLIHAFAGDRLEVGANLETVSKLLAGKNAAVVREVVDRSKLAAVRHTQPGQPLTISAKDLEVATRGMEAHSRMLEPMVVDQRSDIEKGAAVLGDALIKAAQSDVPFLKTLLGGELVTNGHVKESPAAE